MVTVTAAQIEAMLAACGAGDRLVMPAEEIAAGFNRDMALEPGEFGSPTRVAALLSYAAMESWWFRATEEIDWSGDLSSRPYWPYVGRTFGQLTWLGNYQNFGAWAKAVGRVDDAGLFARDPKVLAEPRWATLGPVWYATKVWLGGFNLLWWAEHDPDPAFAVACCVLLGLSPDAARTKGYRPDATQGQPGYVSGLEDRRRAWAAALAALAPLPAPVQPEPAPQPPAPTPSPVMIDGATLADLKTAVAAVEDYFDTRTRGIKRSVLAEVDRLRSIIDGLGS